MRRFIPLILISLLIGLLATSGYGQEPRRRPSLIRRLLQKPKGIGRYVLYTPVNPKLDFTFEYPDNWPVDESKEPALGWSTLMIYGPRNRLDTLSSNIDVTVVPVQDVKARWGSLNEWIALFKEDAKLISEKETLLDHQKAVDLTISYNTPSPPEFEIRFTPVIERIIFLKKGSYIYRIIYGADEEDYAKYLSAFEHFLETFKFKR